MNQVLGFLKQAECYEASESEARRKNVQIF